MLSAELPWAAMVKVLPVEGGAREGGRANAVVERAGADGIKAHRAKDVPGRHLAGVIVAGQAVGTGAELRVHELAVALLRLRGRVGEVVEIGDGVARLVALIVEMVVEEAIELCDEGSPATDGVDEAVDVVRDKEG